MFRRDFIQRIAIAGAAGAASATGQTEETSTVTFSIQGFTCVTCAIGLEVVLRQQKGVTRAKASYPERKAVVTFDPSMTSADTLKKFINEVTGFTVSEADN